MAVCAGALAALPLAARATEAAPNNSASTITIVEGEIDAPWVSLHNAEPLAVGSDGTRYAVTSYWPKPPRFESYFDYLRDSWRIYDHAAGEVIRDYPCDGCVEVSMEGGEFWAHRLADGVTELLNDGIVSAGDVKSWRAIARPTVVTPVIFDGGGNVSYALAQGFPDSWDVPAPKTIGELNWHGVVTD